MAPPIIREVKRHIDPTKEVIIDVSPGTSCPVVEAVKDSDFYLLVTEPAPFGLNDFSLVAELVRKLSIPCGAVINRVGVGDKKFESYCHEQEIPILLRIPLDRDIATLYSKGIPLIEGIPEWHNAFLKLFQNIKEIVTASQVMKPTDWQEVAIDGETHVKRITDVYQELGFEVRLEEVKPDEVEQCIKCFQGRSEKIYRIYMRCKREDSK